MSDDKNDKNKSDFGGSWQEWSKNFNFHRPHATHATEADPRANNRDFVEEIKVNGKNLVSEVERLLREGELRHLRIRYRDRILLDLPVTWAVVGVVLAPQLAAVAAIAGAVVGECTIEVIRKSGPPTTDPAAAAKAAKAESSIPPTPEDLSHR